jgi:hypothetical protein
MIHFLLTYSLTQAKLVDLREFKDSAQASRAYVEAERANGRNLDCEIVLVGADSLETLQTTHAHYFGDQMESTSPHLAGV